MGGEEQGLGEISGAVKAAGGKEGGEVVKGGGDVGGGVGGEAAAREEARHRSVLFSLPIVSARGLGGFSLNLQTAITFWSILNRIWEKLHEYMSMI
jgi:hypothetical protein